ncbi:MAG: DNA polymerase III subunit gamma/tau [Spirochaetales bacterium]
MAYEVTASRRRPQRFEDLIGQDFVVATLKHSITEGKIAHAYLFSGPRGCGKTSTARILAKVLNCAEGAEHAPCGKCTPCLEIVRGSSMDVIEIDGASNTSVNDVRQIKDEILFPPNSCTYKIYIIDEVHMLSMNAFNALLKTIEEPPPYVIFIFATTELHKVPATIKSRCQQFHFRLGSTEQIKQILRDAATETGVQATDEALYWIARESTGSFRDAYTLFDQVAAFSENDITYEKIRDKLGLVGVERLNELCSLCVDGKNAEVMQLFDDILQNGVSVEQFISNMADYIRSLLFIKNGVTKDSVLGQGSERFATNVLNAWSSGQLEHALALFLQLFRDIRYSLSPRFEAELAVFRLCWLSSWVSTGDVKNAIEKAKQALANGIVVSDSPHESTQSHEQKNINHVQPDYADTPIPENNVAVEDKNTEQHTQISMSDKPASLDELKDIIVESMRKTKILLSSSLKQSFDWHIENDNLSVSVETHFLQKQLESERAYIAGIIKEAWGKPVNLMIKLHEISAEQNKPEAVPDDVQMVMDTFNGQIVCVKEDNPSMMSQN